MLLSGKHTQEEGQQISLMITLRMSLLEWLPTTLIKGQKLKKLHVILGSKMLYAAKIR